jgi:hypothetical protein
VTPFLRRLASLRLRLLAGRSAQAGARAAFTVSLVACVLLAGSRILGLEVPAGVAWGAIAAGGLLGALRTAARGFTLRDCAIELDRQLGLEERLSTALDAPAGPMRDAQSADAARALAGVVLPARRIPREAKLLAGSGLLVSALLVLHSPARAGGTEDPALASLEEQAVAALEAVESGRVEFREIKDLVRKGRLEEAAAKLQDLRDRLDQELLKTGGGKGLEREEEAATAGADALSAALARLGTPVRSTLPAAVALKVERQERSLSTVPGLPSDEATVRFVSSVLTRADWPARYDPVIRRYYGSESR